MSAAPPSAPAAPPPFADARGCKDWLNVLPLGNIPQAQTLVLEALRGLHDAGIAGLERLKCLELMRDKIAFLQGEQRSRYFGKTLPLSANDANAWTTGRALLEEMEEGYRHCAAEALESGGDAAPHAALVAQRIVRSIGAQMLFHAIVYRRFDPALWTRLHQQYASAEAAGIAEERVKDSLEGEESVSSVMEAYAQVVLTQAAFLSEVTAPKMDFIAALLKPWARKVRVLAPPGEDAAKSDPLVVDLDKPIGARPQARSELQPGHRIVDTESLSKSIRRRIQGLQHGEDAVALGLPAEAAGVHPLTELQRLHKLWCEGAPPRPAPKAASQAKAGVVFGLGEIHFFVTGGKVFEQPDRKRELTSQEKQDIEVFGRVTERTQSKMVAEHNYTLESWAVVDEMRGAVRVLRPATTSRGVAIGRLAGVRLGDGAPFFLGVVSELVQETDGRIVVTIAVFPGKPEAVAVRTGDARSRAGAHWVQGFRLPALEALKVARSLVVPSGLGSHGRSLETWERGAPAETGIQDVLDRGADFDRLAIS